MLLYLKMPAAAMASSPAKFQGTNIYTYFYAIEER